MKKNLLIAGILTICFWLGSIAFPIAGKAGELESPPEIEHAKLNTADATPVEPRHVELEFGYSYSRAKHSWDDHRDLQSRGLSEEDATGVALTVGAFKDLDFNLGIDYVWLHDADNDPTRDDSIGDVSIGGRYRFLNIETYKLEAAYIGGFTVPTGSKTNDNCLGTSQEFWSWDNTFVLTKDWGRWTTNADVGYSLPFGKKRGYARGTFTANLAAGYQVFYWLQPELELNYSKDFVKSSVDSENLTVTGGLVMPINDRLRMNVGVQQAVWGKNTDKTTTAILAVKIGF
jgi:hypothetical protein